MFDDAIEALVLGTRFGRRRRHIFEIWINVFVKLEFLPIFGSSGRFERMEVFVTQPIIVVVVIDNRILLRISIEDLLSLSISFESGKSGDITFKTLNKNEIGVIVIDVRENVVDSI